jgi:hypothetical protein
VSPETPLLKHSELLERFQEHKAYLQQKSESIGIDLENFRNGLKECRMYN